MVFIKIKFTRGHFPLSHSQDYHSSASYSHAFYLSNAAKALNHIMPSPPLFYLACNSLQVISNQCIICLSFSLDLFAIGWIFQLKFSMGLSIQSNIKPLKPRPTPCMVDSLPPLHIPAYP